MTNHYATLGVTPKADPVVIKAAYRALAQRYHPDRYEGSKDEAHRLMSAINTAYEVLSNPLKRKEYDEQNSYAGDFDDGDDVADGGLKQLYKDWQTASSFYPDLVGIEAALAKTSKRLAFSYVLIMMSAKKFEARRIVAEEMQDLFLRTYFGDRAEILDFARSLIDSGKKEAARHLNEAVRVLGPNLESCLVIHNISTRFGIPVPVVAAKKAPVAANVMREFACPKCNQSLRTRTPGPQKCRCPSCRTVFRISFDTRVYDVGCQWEGD